MHGLVELELVHKFLWRHLPDFDGPVGVVIDKNTALVLKGNVSEVMGGGTVARLIRQKTKRSLIVLKAGDTADIAKQAVLLRSRSTISLSKLPEEKKADQLPSQRSHPSRKGFFADIGPRHAPFPRQ